MSEYPVRVSSEGTRARLVVARIWPRTELFEGLHKICEDHQITAGCITAMHGSLIRARFVFALHGPGTKMNARYGEPVVVEGPLEFLSGSGMIGTMKENSKTAFHIHGVLSDSEMRVYGAHLVETGNPVMSTMELLIEAFDDVAILRAFDEETDFPLFNIAARKG